jgi:hypothetical protein
MARISKKKVAENSVLIFSTTRVWNILIVRRIEPDKI